MPPSPSLRYSPRGDLRGDSHKRGRSLEAGLSFKERDDDDLALFNEMQSRERENFLLEPADDFEDLLSCRTKPLPDFKLGINISARGESSDLLNVDGDKNDYEWLLTPPDTPLFPSLDDEPAPANEVHSGRARSRPISISRSSTMEKSHRSSRGSPSPQRSSPSPRSGTSTFQGRPSSAPHSNPGPSRRPSPPLVKPSTPPPRSLTPTSRRMSTGSPGSVGMSGMRGTSPVRSSRGNSASPKIRAWQSNIPGFSLEVPPNLRTSLADRPASYVRGSSPASRTSRESSSKFGRQSMSPTPSRSIGSSHSQDRDRLSSHSKGSIASSGDDDTDSLQSIPVKVSERPASRKGTSGYPGGRPLSFSKKPTKTFSPSSAPKRSFDSAIRQMDRKTPQNMFRPLLSSVPSSTFYSGNPSTTHHNLTSRNSSVTTNSNASFDLATSAAFDTEGNDHPDDGASDCGRTANSDNHDEVFVFDKMDESRDISSEAHCGEPSCDDRPTSTGQLVVQGDVSTIDCHVNLLTCSICGCRYRPDQQAESEDNICFECKQTETTQSSSGPLMENSKESLTIQSTDHNILNVPQLEAPLSDSQSREVSEVAPYQEFIPEASHHNSELSQRNLESTDVITRHHVTKERRPLDDPSHTIGGFNMDIDVAEGAGISVLLNRSSSVKGPIAHGRTINSSAISFEDLSYSRDLTSSLRSSIGHGSFSASSSIDLTSARYREAFLRRQLSGKVSNSSSKPHSSASSFSGNIVPVYQGVGLSTSSHEGSIDESLSNIRPMSPSGRVVALENAELHNKDPAVAREPMTEEANYEISMSSQENDFSLMASTEVENGLHEIDEQPQKSTGCTESSLAVEGATSEDTVPRADVAEDILQCSSSTMSEIEINESHPSSPSSQIDVIDREDLEDFSTVMHHSIDVKDASLESNESDHAHRIVGESKVIMEDEGGRMGRSLTLEEATDTILFCSSIIHDLAYKAADIAIEKEKENLQPFEGLRPTVTNSDKSHSDRKDPRGISSGKTPKTQKSRKRPTAESESKLPLTQNDEKSNEPNEPVVRNIGLSNVGNSAKPPKLESKCNCSIM